MITHAVQDVERWLGVRASAPRLYRVPRTSPTLWQWMEAITPPWRFDIDDLDALKAVLSSVPPEMAAEAESHGVVMPMTVYVDAGYVAGSAVP